MIRTQVQFTEEQIALLRERARAQNRSVSDLVREAVTRFLGDPAPADRRESAQRAEALVGKFRSGTPDLAAEHDRYLADAFGE